MTAKETLLSKEGAGNDYLGWIDLPVDYDKDEFARIKKAAAKIQSDSDVLLVVGIGGSYLGARAAIEFLSTLCTVCGCVDTLCSLFFAIFFDQHFLKYTECDSWLCGCTGLGNDIDGEILSS